MAQTLSIINIHWVLKSEPSLNNKDGIVEVEVLSKTFPAWPKKPIPKPPSHPFQ